MPAADRSVAALGRLADATPGGERRKPQDEMSAAVADAIGNKRHLLAQAGTGTGKSWAYLVPAILSGKRTVVATATKALQDQLAGKDLPFLQEHLGREFDFAVLKGRSNYVCQQRIAEISGGQQMALDGLAERASPTELASLKLWAATTPTGDRAELLAEPSHQAWGAVSVSAQECPGAKRCPKGDVCFAELARRKAADADVVVVNLHLLGLDLATDGAVLPEHEVVVVDEAHQLEDIISDTCGFELSAGRFQNLARSVRAILDDPATSDDIETSASLLAAVLSEHVGRRLKGALDPAIADALSLARARLDRVANALRAIPDDAGDDVATRKTRAVQLTTGLMVDVAAAGEVPATSVAWVEGPDHNPKLRVAPIDVAELLRAALWDRRPAILTSATLPDGMAERLGLTPTDHDEIDVGSPFDYEHHGLLYCAAHLPDPREPGFEPGMHDDLVALIEAAGGRTLALFTSYRAMDAAIEAVRPRVSGPILGQRDLPKPALVAAFTEDESACLFATMGFWQGIDVPGRTLSLVTIDRLPFPRPDEPLLQARRERAKADAFRLIDLPRTSMMLAQGVGRLIRSATDEGVVAVFDPRLAKAKRYRWDLLNALPPLPRTKERAEAEAFLRRVTAEAPA
ncbi:ATP-dependent DNA helicase [Aquihabitans sp. G128]|uniref:ATP-dependent DNA helicase n=1 Tax=Aquihabitans sp. G128 TaxID=2849779 RepID=UPI001C246329|nr:ATP-dependent DNA helicase [Aquihabitans sp. G128]QXC62389.1 ATP-dependent DNA helicase [Aquihabitans sp. G128]